MTADQLPPTASTWIAQEWDRGREREVARHVMTVYRDFLVAYLQAYLQRQARFRKLGEASDLVSGFFSSRLSQRSFFDGWRSRDVKLRYWLLGCVKLYLREREREEDEWPPRPLPEQVSDSAEPVEAEMDREFARTIVRQACEAARLECERRGHGTHWKVLVGRYFEGRPYEELAEAHRVASGQARGMARTAREQFRKALREIVKRDVGLENIDAEIRKLIEALSS